METLEPVGHSGGLSAQSTALTTLLKSPWWLPIAETITLLSLA